MPVNQTKTNRVFRPFIYGHTCVPKHFACLREAASAKAGCAGTRAYTTATFQKAKGLQNLYQFNCLKLPYKIPPNLPFSKGGERYPPFDSPRMRCAAGKGGYRGIRSIFQRAKGLQNFYLLCSSLSLFSKSNRWSAMALAAIGESPALIAL